MVQVLLRPITASFPVHNQYVIVRPWVVRLYTPIPHRPRIPESPRIDFLLIGGDSLGFINFFSPIVMVYESVPIQIRFRYEYSGELESRKNSLRLAK